MQAHRHHDISDKVWEKISPHLFGGKGSVGRLAKNNRQFINAVFRILRTGSPQSDLPPDSGHWMTPCGIIKGHEWNNSGIQRNYVNLFL